MADLRQAPAYRRHQSLQSWRHLPLGHSFLAWRKLPLWPWPVAKFQRAPLPPVKTLNEVGKTLRLTSFYLEPAQITAEQKRELKQTGWKPNHQPLVL